MTHHHVIAHHNTHHHSSFHRHYHRGSLLITTHHHSSLSLTTTTIRHLGSLTPLFVATQCHLMYSRHSTMHWLTATVLTALLQPEYTSRYYYSHQGTSISTPSHTTGTKVYV